jgi:hypothetical protein
VATAKVERLPITLGLSGDPSLFPLAKHHVVNRNPDEREVPAVGDALDKTAESNLATKGNRGLSLLAQVPDRLESSRRRTFREAMSRRRPTRNILEPWSDPLFLRVEKTPRNSANPHQDGFLRFASSAKAPLPVGIYRHLQIVGKQYRLYGG